MVGILPIKIIKMVIWGMVYYCYTNITWFATTISLYNVYDSFMILITSYNELVNADDKPVYCWVHIVAVTTAIYGAWYICHYLSLLSDKSSMLSRSGFQPSRFLLDGWETPFVAPSGSPLFIGNI